MCREPLFFTLVLFTGISLTQLSFAANTGRDMQCEGPLIYTTHKSCQHETNPPVYKYKTGKDGKPLPPILRLEVDKNSRTNAYFYCNLPRAEYTEESDLKERLFDILREGRRCSKTPINPWGGRKVLPNNAVRMKDITDYRAPLNDIGKSSDYDSLNEFGFVDINNNYYRIDEYLCHRFPFRTLSTYNCKVTFEQYEGELRWQSRRWELSDEVVMYIDRPNPLCVTGDVDWDFTRPFASIASINNSWIDTLNCTTCDQLNGEDKIQCLNNNLVFIRINKYRPFPNAEKKQKIRATELIILSRLSRLTSDDRYIHDYKKQLGQLCKINRIKGDCFKGLVKTFLLQPKKKETLNIILLSVLPEDESFLKTLVLEKPDLFKLFPSGVISNVFLPERRISRVKLSRSFIKTVDQMIPKDSEKRTLLFQIQLEGWISDYLDAQKLSMELMQNKSEINKLSNLDSAKKLIAAISTQAQLSNTISDNLTRSIEQSSEINSDLRILFYQIVDTQVEKYNKKAKLTLSKIEKIISTHKDGAPSGNALPAYRAYLALFLLDEHQYAENIDTLSTNIAHVNEPSIYVILLNRIVIAYNLVIKGQERLIALVNHFNFNSVDSASNLSDLFINEYLVSETPLDSNVLSSLTQLVGGIETQEANNIIIQIKLREILEATFSEFKKGTEESTSSLDDVIYSLFTLYPKQSNSSKEFIYGYTGIKESKDPGAVEIIEVVGYE